MKASWTEVALGDVSDQVRGVTYKKADSGRVPVPGKRGVVRAGNISGGRLTSDDLVYVPSGLISPRQLLRANDVLVATSSGSLSVVGKAAEVRTDTDVGFGAFCKVMRPHPTIDPRYFAHCFKTLRYQRHVRSAAEGANINNLRTADLDDYGIPLPPIEEQRRIAAVLDAADELRARRRQAIAKLDTLTQAIFIDMFGDPVRNPMGWPDNALGAVVADLHYGHRFYDDSYSDNGTPIVRITDLDASGGLDFSSMPRMRVTDEELERHSLRPGELIFARSGATVGKTALVRAGDPQCIAGAYFICLTFDESIDPSYAFAVLTSARVQSIIARKSRQAAQQNFSGPGLRRLPMPVPPLGLQAEYARRVGALRERRQLYDRGRVEVDDLVCVASAASVSGRVVTAQFGFLRADFAEQHEIAVRVERYALDDPGTSIIHARRALESAVRWVYANDTSLSLPYEETLNAMLHEPAFRRFEDGKVFDLARRIQKAGNRAVHESKAPTQAEAIQIASALHLILYWLGFRYGRTKPEPGHPFDPNLLPREGAVDVEQKQRNLAARQELEVRLAEEAADAEAARAELVAAHQTLEEVEAERARLIAEVTAARLAAETAPEGSIDWSEAITRTKLIDLYLGEAGWKLAGAHDREFEVVGMPFGSGTGYVDYVLWGDDGLPLAVVEAKKTRTSEQAGKHQAVLYADCLEAMTGRRPVVYYTNGYTHWLWNDTSQPPRKVQGFHTRDELELIIQRRTTVVPTSTLDIDDSMVERSYQHRAIRAITDHIEVDGQRKALVVMATGAGKTRTVIALCDLLMRSGLVRRALFLADRTALVDQAVGAFKEHAPDVTTVNLTTEPNEDGRVYVSTYQTMVGKIDERRNDGTRRFGVGHFDLVIIDEAHRSVYRKYRGIFDYFDSYLVGLTATPRDEIDTNTYDLFDLETGVPTDSYSLDDAIDDGYLVPPINVSVPMQFVREGIRYEDRTEEEQEQWEEFDWGVDDDGLPLEMPEEVSAGELNKFLFNEDTVDKVLEYLMTNGIRVAGGERLGKTIVFAKNQRHADYICERFDANYPNHAGKFAQVITHNINYAKDLIDKFKMPERAPHIAISVDMLDTGIDVPEVVNLVFFKLVRSKTKFWQMIGRGTRLSTDLFGLGHDKTEFRVFDFCQNLEYFSQPMVPSTGSGVTSLSERIFTTRLDLLERLDALDTLDDERAEIAGILRERLASMNDDNFLVRAHLELVERFRDLAAWEQPSHEELATLRSDIASLPDQLDPEHEDAKRFDVLVLNAQLGTVSGEPFERERKRIVRLASALEDMSNVPIVAAQLELIQAVQADEWWVDASYQMLEDVRRKLRLLIPLIERIRRGQVFSDFEDTIGEGEHIVLPGTGGAGGGTGEFAQFRRKAESFLRDHLGEAAVAKVRSGEPLGAADIAELQRILVAAGIGDDETFAEASDRAGNFGRFVRGLVGLDRAAAKGAFNAFLDDRRFSRKQIEFVEIVINELADNGVVEPGRFYESPYSGLAPTGPEDLFGQADLNELFDQLKTLSTVVWDGRPSAQWHSN